MKQKIKDKLWENGKYANDYPQNYIVIPVLKVIEILEAEG